MSLLLLQPSWQLSATMSCAFAGTAAALVPAESRAARVVGAFAREFAVVWALLGLWQYVGHLVHTRVAGALDRGRAIDQLQHALHLPSEATLQALILPFPDVVRAANVYYEYAHLNGMAIFLVWLWWRHRATYPAARNTVICSTLACLLIQIVPVAPPRLLPDLGFVDTAMLYGQSVYGPFDAGLANQLSAMPSVHVAWAVIVGWYVARAGTSRWRWVGPAHAVLTVLVVSATANHWWMDGVVAAAIVAVLIAGQALIVRGLAARAGAAVR